MKTISIFLASSITELSNERTAIGAYFQKLNNIFYDKGVFFKFIICENMDDAIAINNKQEEYNEAIKSCDLCIFLFFTKIGVYTRKEFDIALNSYRNTNKPRIITYFKIDNENNQTDDLKVFISFLENSLNHYYNQFSHIDSLLLGIITNIHLLKIDDFSISFDKDCGKIMHGENELLSIENIPAWNDNDFLNDIKNQIQDGEAILRRVKTEYLENPEDEEKFEIFNKQRENLLTLKSDLRNKQERVFSTLVSCAEKMLSSECSSRLVQANILLHKGKWIEASVLLEETENDISVVYAQIHKADELEKISIKLKENANCKAKTLFEELLLGIRILSTIAKSAIDWNQMENKYAQAVKLSKDFGFDKQILYDYACFLLSRNYAEKAIDYVVKYYQYLENINAEHLSKAKTLCKLVEIFDKAKQTLIGPEDYADTLGLAFTYINKYIYELEEKEITADNLTLIGKCYLQLARYWNHSYISELRDEKTFKKALTLLPLTRRVWNNLTNKANIFLEVLSAQTLRKSFELLDQFEKCGSPHRELASMDYLNESALLMANLIFYTAEDIQRKMTKMKYVYGTYDNGECLFEMGNMQLMFNADNAENFYHRALWFFSLEYSDDEIGNRFARNFRGLIYLNLYQYWHRKHIQGFIQTGKQWSDFEILDGRNPKITCEELAVEYLQKGLNLFEHLYKINPYQYANGLSTTYNMLGEREQELGNFEKAVIFYSKVETIYSQLPTDIDRSSGIHKTLIESYNRIARIYLRYENNPEIALSFYEKALQKCLKLSEDKYIEFFSMQINIYLDKAGAHAAISDFDIAMDLIYKKALGLILVLAEKDHQMKFHCWDLWFETITIFRENLIGMVKNRLLSMSILEKFFSEAIKTTEYVWVNEVALIGVEKVDLLIPDSVRGVNKLGKEDYVIDWLSKDFQTVIVKAAIEEAIYLAHSKKEQEAEKIIRGRLDYFNSLLENINKDKNYYLSLVINNDIQKLNVIITEAFT